MSEWIGAITLLVALVTLYYVVRTDRRERKYLPHVDLHIDALGHANDARTGELLWHCWNIRNEGTADAKIMFLKGVGCQVVYDNDYRVVHLLRTGESRDLKVEPCEEDKAWVLVGWASPYERRQWHVEWFPPKAGTELKQALVSNPTPRWRRWIPTPMRRLILRTEAVGPGGAVATHVSTHPTKLRKQLALAMSLADPDADEKIEDALDEFRSN